MGFSRSFSRQGRSLILAEMLALLFGIGFLDFNSGYEVSLSIFYSVPIFMTAWCCTKKDAILVALIAGLIWWWANFGSGHAYLQSWHEAWETFVRLGFFIFVAIGADSLRSQRDAAASRIALLEHSQKLEREIIGISEREQRRIGQDLHDGLCQYLAALSCAATSLQGDLKKLELSSEAKVAGELAKFLQDAVLQTRDLSRGLAPVPIGEDGLASALEDLAQSVNRLQGVDCTFSSNQSSPNYDEKSAMHLYRIAQEAINNATKHGKARKIDISIQTAGENTTLRIADDGTGISHTIPGRRGMGLNIMNYRARVSGGELRIEEPAHGGTVVSCTLSPAKQDFHEQAA